jgi:O-antigen/teichoic acid export membrane protein
MSEVRSAVKAFTSVYVARIAAAGLVFASTVIIARVLGAAGFAAFSTIVAVISVASGLLGPALDTTLVRFAAVNGRNDAGDPGPHARVIFTAKLLLAAAILLVGAIASPSLSRLLLSTEADPDGNSFGIFLGFATAAFVTLWTTFQSYTQARQQFTLYAGLEFAAAGLRLALIAAAVFVGLRSVNVMVGCNTLAGIMLVFLSVLAARIRRPVASMDDVRVTIDELFRYGKWVLAASCCTSLFQRLDILFLASMHYPQETIGHYGAAVQLMIAVEMAVLTMFNVLLPKASALKSRVELQTFMRQFRKLSAGLAIAMLPFVFISPYLARVVFGAEYVETGSYLLVLLLGSLASLAFAPAGAVIYAMGESHYIALLEAVKLVLFAIVGGYAALRFGAYEVAIALAGVKGLISVTTFLIARHEVARVNQ